MFALWTVAAIWLGLTARKIHERRELRERILAADDFSSMYLGNDAVESNGVAKATVGEFVEKLMSFQPSESGEWGGLRDWLGDTEVTQVIVENDSDVDEIRRVFPEATVFVVRRIGTASYKASGEVYYIVRKDGTDGVQARP